MSGNLNDRCRRAPHGRHHQPHFSPQGVQEGNRPGDNFVMMKMMTLVMVLLVALVTVWATMANMSMPAMPITLMMTNILYKCEKYKTLAFYQVISGKESIKVMLIP